VHRYCFYSLDVCGMKNFFFLLLMLVLSASSAIAQNDSTNTGRLVEVRTTEDNKFIGTIISDDGVNMVILTTTIGKVSIPKLQIKSIKYLDEGQGKSRSFNPGMIQHHRYILNKNALPMEENQVQMHMPMLCFGLVDIGFSERFSLTAGTFWFAAFGFQGNYIIPTKSAGNFGISAGVGGLVRRFGTSNTMGQITGFNANVYYTLGDEKRNFTIGGGYLSNFEGRNNSYYFNFGGQIQFNNRMAVITEGAIAPEFEGGTFGFALRLLSKKGNTWDLGISYLLYEDLVYQYYGNGYYNSYNTLVGIPFPVVGFHKDF
jgi:hypothetical protein